MNRKLIGLCIATVALVGPGTAQGFDQFHGATPVPKLNYDSLYAAATPLADSPDGQAVVENCLARYGGIEKLQELKGLRFQYRTKTFMGRDTIAVTKTFHTGRQHKIIRRNPLFTETRVLNKDKALYIGADTLMVLDRSRYKAELFSYLTLAMPLAIKTERFDGIRYGKRPNDDLAYIYLNKQDSIIMALGIDPGDSLIKSSEGAVYEAGEVYVFINKLSDHRRQDGYLFPFHLINVSMGLEVAQSILTTVEVNPKFDSEEFEGLKPVDPKRVH